MEYFWCASFVFAPLIVAAVIWAVCRLRRGKICRSTADLFRSALHDDRGQNLVEYALMAGFVATAAVAVMPSVAQAVRVAFGRACAAIDGVAYVATPTQSLSIDPTQIVFAVLAVVLLGVIILRRPRNPYN